MIEKIRNIAIIAHVDHGKTTLVDKLLQVVSSERDTERMAERAMDSNDLEKERGITILSKNTTIYYQDHKINIVDTPGHADFGGEVERVLNMVDSVLLLVDAFEGPMPQTKYVLQKAMMKGLKPIVVINKIDRDNAQPEVVLEKLYDLLIELDADEDQLEFPFIYASAKEGYIKKTPNGPEETMVNLLDMVIEHVAAPKGDPEKSLQLQLSTLDYNNYVGVIGTGRISNGSVQMNQTLEMNYDGKKIPFKITKIIGYDGLKRIDCTEAFAGDIVTIAGSNEFKVGATIGLPGAVEPLPLIEVDQPTLSMTFMVNDSPLAGTEGKFLTSRHLRDRLEREALANVALRVEETDSTEKLKVSGRGELHLSVLVETMRREGFELQLSRPEVIIKEVDGIRMEPYEEIVIDVPEEFSGTVIEKLNKRMGMLQGMEPSSGNTVKIIYRIPAKNLIGYRSEFLTDTKGEGVLYSIFDGYDKLLGDVRNRKNGVLISGDFGKAIPYALFHLQDRGIFFVNPGDSVYEGQVIGIHTRGPDLVVNPTKQKKLTNVRASGTDEAVRILAPIEMSLEKAMEFIGEDEYVEVTPLAIRIRKKLLSANDRKRSHRS